MDGEGRGGEGGRGCGGREIIEIEYDMIRKDLMKM
jgi:hypothetical protein